MAVGPSPVLGLKCFVSRRTEKKKQRKHHPLAQLIKVINTLAILFIVIPELTKFRTTKCLGHLLCFLGHLNIVRVPLILFVLHGHVYQRLIDSFFNRRKVLVCR